MYTRFLSERKVSVRQAPSGHRSSPSRGQMTQLYLGMGGKTMRDTNFFIPASDRPDIVTKLLKGSPDAGPQLTGCGEKSGGSDHFVPTSLKLPGTVNPLA